MHATFTPPIIFQENNVIIESEKTWSYFISSVQIIDYKMRLTSIRFVEDFFGLSKITTKTISGISSEFRLTGEKIKTKYEPLLGTRDKPANEEKLIDKHHFGAVRFDCDNIASIHGQFEPDNTNPLYDTKLVRQRFVETTDNATISENLDDPGPDLHFSNPDLAEILTSFKRREARLTLKNKPPLTFEFTVREFDGQPNDKECEPKPTLSFKIPKQAKINHNLNNHTNQGAIPDDVPETKLSGHLERVEPKLIIRKKFVEENTEPILKHNKEFDEPEDSCEEVYEEPEIPEIKQQKDTRNAYEYIKSFREEKGPIGYKIKLDSKGYHDFSSQVIDWSKVRRVDAVQMLKDQIIYDNYDVIAINKPYGLSSHCETGKRQLFDVNSLMQEVAQQMHIEKLYLAHRLDKTTSGVLIFARTQQRAKKLNKLFKGDLIKKTYLCITKRVPDPPHAIIDIPIGEFTVAGKARSCLVPESWPAEKQIAVRYREARRAVSEYKVIKSTEWAALVEVKPRSGVKHQIRCHMAYALNTPIIGDHKYDHLMKIAPQDLPGPLLKKLHLRQQKVRTLPVHLHSRTIVLPDIKPDGQSLFIHAPLPHHFKDVLKRLDLNYEE